MTSAAVADADAQLRLIKTLWGVDDPVSPELFQSIRKEGYHGVEIIRLAWKEALHDNIINDNDNDCNRHSQSSVLVDSLNQAGLQAVCQIHTAGGYLSTDGEYVYCGAYDVGVHLESFRTQLDECMRFLQRLDAHDDGSCSGFVNVHAGVDAWSMAEAMDFLTASLRLIDESNLPFQVTFETHRQRLFGSPFQTRDLLSQHGGRELARLRLNADLSHWYCTCERVFDASQPRDEPWWPPFLEQLAMHCNYIHARLGWAQGPQMADPSADECRNDRELQLAVWKRLLTSMKRRPNGTGGKISAALCYMSPEYGPPPYLPVLPHTQEPVASLPGAVDYTKNLLVKLFEEDN